MHSIIAEISGSPVAFVSKNGIYTTIEIHVGNIICNASAKLKIDFQMLPYIIDTADASSSVVYY